MNNVYTRNRKKTNFDVVTNAEKLQDMITLYIMGENKVPKKWRFMIGKGVIEKIDELNDNVIAANSIYAMNEEDLARRKAYLNRSGAHTLHGVAAWHTATHTAQFKAWTAYLIGCL